MKKIIIVVVILVVLIGVVLFVKKDNTPNRSRDRAFPTDISPEPTGETIPPPKESESPKNESNTEEKILLETKFEENTIGTPTNAIENLNITGTDFGVFNMPIHYEGGTENDRWARIDTDPDDPNNNVLRYWLKNAVIPRSSGNGTKGRIATKEPVGVTSFTQTHRMRLGSSMKSLQDFPDSIGWFTIHEWFSNRKNSNSPDQFRVTVDISKQAGIGESLHYVAYAKDGSAGSWNTIWVVAGEGYDIPIEEWVDVKIEYVMGDENTGRFTLSVLDNSGTWSPIIDVQDRTQSVAGPKSVTQYSAFKIYTSDTMIDWVRDNAEPVEIFWDDLKITVPEI